MQKFFKLDEHCRIDAVNELLADGWEVVNIQTVGNEEVGTEVIVLVEKENGKGMIT